MFNLLNIKCYVLDDVELNPGTGGSKIGVDNIAGIDYEVVKTAFGDVGTVTLVSPTNPLPVTDAVAEAALASIAAEDFATHTAQTDKSQFTKLTDGTHTALITVAGEQNVIATAQPGVVIGKVGIDQTTPGTTNGVQVNAALPAGTNVIGHVINDSGSTTAVTGNVTVVQGTGTNLHTVVDSGTITSVTQNADVRQATAANLNATVVQATGTNLHTVVDSGTLTAVTAITNPLPAGTNVIGHVINDSGSTTAVTGNVTVVQGTGTNLHTVIDSGTITTVTAVTSITNPLPAGTNVIGHVITDATSVTNATLNAETTKVIGVTRSADGGGNLLTSTGNALDVNVKTVDPFGTLRQLNVLPPVQNSQNVAPLATSDVTMFEGATMIEIMAQILIELKISNQYMSDLPMILQLQNGRFDEPNVYRNDPTFFVK